MGTFHNKLQGLVSPEQLQVLVVLLPSLGFFRRGVDSACPFLPLPAAACIALRSSVHPRVQGSAGPGLTKQPGQEPPPRLPSSHTPCPQLVASSLTRQLNDHQAVPSFRSFCGGHTLLPVPSPPHWS